MSLTMELDLERLAMSPEDAAALDTDARMARVAELLQEAFDILDYGIESMITTQDRRVAAICILFSGGNDSTTLAHIFRLRADFAIHANTTIGIEQTRQFVRDTCELWKLPLKEISPPPGSTYRELVMEQGFPGPALHYKMYQRLKERALQQARREIVIHPRQERVVFLAGRRRTESARRANVPELNRTGSIVWISPLVNWTKVDLNTYREIMGDVPRNEVADLIHMSGECLCGAFAHKNELEEVGMFFPDVVAEIKALEAEVRAAGKAPEQRCNWGWGATKNITAGQLKSGPLCTSCEYRMDQQQEHAH